MMYFVGGVPNIVLGPSFGMATFIKCMWMCERECWGIVLKSPVYSACGVVLMLREVGAVIVVAESRNIFWYSRVA